MKVINMQVVPENKIEALAIEQYGDDINLYGQQRDGFLEGFKQGVSDIPTNILFVDREIFYDKTDRVISMFKDGQNLYKTSAIFNKTVQSIVRGADIYEVMEQLILISEDSMKALQFKITKDPFTQTNF